MFDRFYCIKTVFSLENGEIAWSTSSPSMHQNSNYINQDSTIKWAPSSEFVSSSIPSWQILTAHAQPFRGARDLAFCLKVTLDSLLVFASCEGSGETARMRRLAWTFAARIGDKYQICLSRSKWNKMSTQHWNAVAKEIQQLNPSELSLRTTKATKSNVRPMKTQISLPMCGLIGRPLLQSFGI